jgi:hypothetical protein
VALTARGPGPPADAPAGSGSVRGGAWPRRAGRAPPPREVFGPDPEQDPGWKPVLRLNKISAYLHHEDVRFAACCNL